jgi:hypothetical protein
MKIKYLAFGATTLALIAVSFGSEAASIGGETWEYNMTVEVAGMKMPMPSSKVCVRPEEGYTPPVDKNCQLKEHEIKGETTTFTITCGAPEPGELKGEFTRKGDSIEGVYSMTQEGESMTVTTIGRKLGECDPSKPATIEMPK